MIRLYIILIGKARDISRLITKLAHIIRMAKFMEKSGK